MRRPCLCARPAQLFGRRVTVRLQTGEGAAQTVLARGGGDRQRTARARDGAGSER